MLTFTPLFYSFNHSFIHPIIRSSILIFPPFKQKRNRTTQRRNSTGVADDDIPLQSQQRRRSSNRSSNRSPQIVTNPHAVHQWVFLSSDYDTTPASDESRHGAVLHRLDTSTASSFFADSSNSPREPLACSSPRRLNETQISISSEFHSLDNSGFVADDNNVDQIELTGAVSGNAAATGNATAAAASNNDDDEEVVFDITHL